MTDKIELFDEDNARSLTKTGQDVMMKMLSDKRVREAWGELAATPQVEEGSRLDYLTRALEGTTPKTIAEELCKIQPIPESAYNENGLARAFATVQMIHGKAPWFSNGK